MGDALRMHHLRLAQKGHGVARVCFRCLAASQLGPFLLPHLQLCAGAI